MSSYECPISGQHDFTDYTKHGRNICRNCGAPASVQTIEEFEIDENKKLEKINFAKVVSNKFSKKI